MLLGDFNARVGKDQQVWNKVLGKDGTGTANSNGEMATDEVRRTLPHDRKHTFPTEGQIKDLMETPRIRTLAPRRFYHCEAKLYH